ncbi:MAG: sulfatase-like hydrolase/transferase [Candidatus Sumerlaeota bacterium]|nr:sulfatase-like hydrolase/transferase [Candidatus Sumerlaeota bacterium]
MGVAEAAESATSAERGARAGRPNILFVFSDQQRWDTMGCYGQRLPISPNLDRLASEGVRFEYAFTPQPVCGPARAVLQTGKYATETTCYKNDVALPLSEKTLAHYLSGAGYEVGYVGKWHLASSGAAVNFRTLPVPPERRGGYKDFWIASDVLEFTSDSRGGFLYDADMKKHEFQKYRVDAVTDYALEFLQSRKGAAKPFFLFLSYIEPHHQNNHNRFEGPDGCKEKFKDYDIPTDLKDHKGDWRENFPDYLGCCNSLDANFARLRAELERQGQWDNTLVIYTSDHGCHFRTRNSEYKRSCHESCLRIPMILHGPGFDVGKVVKELVSLIDLPPTILTAGGAPVPKIMRGHPLQSLCGLDETAAQAAAREWPQDIFSQISESHVGRSLRTKKWKYSVRAAKGDAGAGLPKGMAATRYVEDFLYDLERDPYEQSNLVDDPAYKDIRKQLSQRLVQYMVEAGEARPEISAANE